MLIQHGEQDHRVRVSQAEEYYAALKIVGVPPGIEVEFDPKAWRGGVAAESSSGA